MNHHHPHDNIDPAEIAKFGELAARWWDAESEFKPL
ncbi:MAG: bifunctional 3-demethylubiquinol 3-O-methyltransferase/2-polyprenyl-6-hydroxyphenol methylase, partial [Alphaproteobacteria bacterium]|nr:bifunctional 3-demethylubiquinol 3-O-methyltransferase/2-polyprenyl-6-hydroxyphenol methylase [Alphaproteobacteria bacterium]